MIVDGRHLARWQAESVRAIASDHDFIVYNCTNTVAAPRRARHALYYLLNLFTIRNAWTRSVPLPSDLDIADVVDFEAIPDGNWQALPDALLKRIVADAPLAIVKFGMGLLRVPPKEVLAVPILSYHHGDPRAFRGRPAGYYELDSGTGRMGQIVQILSNDLDGGAIVAFAETKVHPHSYRKTLIEAFGTSPLLLRRAIANASSGQTIPPGKGKVFRLPSNLHVAQFCAARTARSVRRLLYGGFMEKRWQVAEAEADFAQLEELASAFPPAGQWQIQAMPPGYRFIADPFYHPGGRGILVEALRWATGRGEILALGGPEPLRLSLGDGHCSYPATISSGDEHFLIPETASWSPPRLYRLRRDDAEFVREIEIESRPRLLDPTFFQHGEHVYLFANRADEGSDILRLWRSSAVTARFTEHPLSPLRISPAGSRMAGGIARDGKSLWRFGQDLTHGYGDGVVLFAIDALSPTEYRESERARLKFDHVRGPHTLNLRDDRVLFDFYRDEVSPLAGVRRLLARAGVRSASMSP